MNSMVLAILTIFILAGIVHADPYVTAAYEPLEIGGYRLGFVLHTDEGHGDCHGWGLFTTGVADLIAPYGWNTYSDFRRTSWNASSTQYVVHPGQTLGGFFGTFATRPAQLAYYVGMTGPGVFNGTLVPSPIPEPSSLLALCAGIGAMGALIRRRSG